jgi:sugar/nucleoside kinase (ribokinase family)
MFVAAGVAAQDKVAAAQRFVLQYAQICVVSLGAKGCVARHRDGTVGRAPAGGVKVVDTIGAGDYFTSGFLYAHLMGCSLQQCAAVGCQSGSEAVKVKGSILSEAAWRRLRSRVDELVAGAAAQPDAANAAAVCIGDQEQQQGSVLATVDASYVFRAV